MKPGTVSRTALSGILAGVEAPAFECVLATVMAIYAPVTRRGVFPNYEKLDDDNKQRADQELADLEGRAQKSMQRLKSALPTSRVVVLDLANHYVFLSNESEVVRLVRAFLLETPTR